MVSCTSCGCSSTPRNKRAGITFHRFPTEAERKQNWIGFLNQPGCFPKSSSLLCSLHFEQQYFDRTSKFKVRLSSNAVPTIEVDRIKYLKSVDGTEDDVPTPSKQPSTATADSEHSPCKKTVKKNSDELHRRDIMLIKRLRTLQKKCWRQKKIISTLKNLVCDLRHENLLLQEGNVLMQNFGDNEES